VSSNLAYTGRDHPHQWNLDLPFVGAFLENSIHYDVDTDVGAAEWNATLPSGGAVLYLGTAARPFTLAMFHELRCLNIVREIIHEFYADSSPNTTVPRKHLATHCMNYLRQMVLCRADTRLQTVRASKGGGRTVLETMRTCRDWTAVYEAAEVNYADFIARVSSAR
jgi:hypothetical protein